MTAHIYPLMGDELELTVTRRPGEPLGVSEGCNKPLAAEFHGVDQVVLTTRTPCPDLWAHQKPRPGLVRRFLRWLV